jgi:hypothetical protein
MNSLCLKRESTAMREVNKRLFQIDVSHAVSRVKARSDKELQQDHFDEIQNVLWKKYTADICSMELMKYQRTCDLQNDSRMSKERRYYVSTPARRMFKKLMVLKRFEDTASAIVDIASELHISHKAASAIVKDSIGFDTITETVVDGRKRYTAQDWWAESMMKNGAHWLYVNTEDIIRSRSLYSEFARVNEKMASDTQFNIS